MNPLTKVKLINELNQREAEFGVKDSVSWHSAYKDSAWIFIGGFPYELTEGDLICVFSQYGEIANINLVRDKKTGKSKGFCFICYEDQRSTILAVDNFNGIKIKGRTIRVDHVLNYRPPKDTDDIDDVTKRLREEGCAPTLPPSSSESEEEEYAVVVKKGKKDKKEKKKKKEKKEKKKAKEEKREEQAQSPPSPVRVKQERPDAGYEKYAQQRAPEDRLPRDGRHEERMYRERQDDGRVREREREREREWDGQAREEERRKDRGRDGRDGDEMARRSRDGGGRHRDGGRHRREDRHRREERHHREDSDRERERSGRQREHSRDREHRRS